MRSEIASAVLEHVADRSERAGSVMDRRIRGGEQRPGRHGSSPRRRMNGRAVADQDGPCAELDPLFDGRHAHTHDRVAETIGPRPDPLVPACLHVEAVDDPLLIAMARLRHDHQPLAEVANWRCVLVRDRLM